MLKIERSVVETIKVGANKSHLNNQMLRKFNCTKKNLSNHWNHKNVVREGKNTDTRKNRRIMECASRETKRKRMKFDAEKDLR